MTRSSNLWTEQLELDFHKSVARLHTLTETPNTSLYYRDLPMPTSTIHTLSFQDELQIADNLAFLSHWDEGADSVSSITLQEHGIGLTVLLASNTTPPLGVSEGLREIKAILSEYAVIKRRRQQFYQRLFDRVMNLDEKRILTRIKPPWVQQPPHIRKKRAFLGDQLSKTIALARQQLVTNPQTEHLLQQLEELQQTVELIRKSPDSNKRVSIMKAVVIGCAEVAAIGSDKSIESYLKTLGAPSRLYEAPEIQQIDKLARYPFICKDLLCVARKPEYTDLFRQICIKCLDASKGCYRKGAHQHCFIHAEMQQVMHYERQPHWPPPRAIGCSKSACFLCDLFIHTQKRYRISHSHRRLYEKWTIPNVDWMTETQAQTFRAIVRSMILDLKKAIKKYHVNPFFRPFPLESRAFLPLSGGSTASGVTMKNVVINSTPSFQKDLHQGETSHPSTSILITRNDLPFRRYVPAKQPFLSIQLGMLSIIFESTKISNMQLTIDQADMSSRPELKTFKAPQISTKDEVDITNSISNARVAFRLQLDSFYIDIELLWIS